MEKNVLKVITDAMLEKKGQQVVSLDLSSIGTAISDYFVVCNADSTTAVRLLLTTLSSEWKRNVAGRCSECRDWRMISGLFWIMVIS